MAIKYFLGHDEALAIREVTPDEFAALFPGVAWPDQSALFVTIGRWSGGWMRGVRRVAFKPSRAEHKCDSRCINAKGPDCSCMCNGANHGVGTFNAMQCEGVT